MQNRENAFAPTGIQKQKNVRILAIETSCDETAAAVVEDGRHVLSNVLYSQIEIHRAYGGVVPEIASRNHVEKLPYIVQAALQEAGMSFAELDAIAVTAGPGLVGALLTGVSYAKALAYTLKKPLIAINHMEGHIAANYITHLDLAPPFICLIASGGHSDIILVRDYGDYTLLGQTRDDAAGEAFDKVARVLGLPYPGGPEIEKLALHGEADAFSFTKAFRGEKHLDFSFSGLKTAVIQQVRKLEAAGELEARKADIAASFQKSVVTALVENTMKAAQRSGVRKVVFGGGVSANGALRAMAEKETAFEVYFPALKYCTDNAAMIAAAAFYKKEDLAAYATLSLNASATSALQYR